jgi:hypothetical protein
LNLKRVRRKREGNGKRRNEMKINKPGRKKRKKADPRGC